MPRFGRTKKSNAIRFYLLEAVKGGRKSLVADASQMFNVSRQAIHKHLSALVDMRYLIAEGATRSRTYHLGPHRWYAGVYNLNEIDEFTVHQRDFSFVFDGLPKNVAEICHYGFTEMVNNAIDHSEGQEVYIETERDEEKVTIRAYDDGEGIFNRITRLLKLGDPREAILELAKGKLTTDPENHTGEGIFFTSRVFDSFIISSGDLDFTHLHELPADYLMHSDNEYPGTNVSMDINANSEREMGNVFDEYSGGPEEYRFERTVVPVHLALYEGEHLVSRSQAKRLLNRVERFRYVILDFEGVDSVGQAFADEVFRVFHSRHPEIELVPVNMDEQITKMMRRALAAKSDAKDQSNS